MVRYSFRVNLWVTNSKPNFFLDKVPCHVAIGLMGKIARALGVAEADTTGLVWQTGGVKMPRGAAMPRYVTIDIYTTRAGELVHIYAYVNSPWQIVILDTPQGVMLESPLEPEMAREFLEYLFEMFRKHRQNIVREVCQG